MADAVMGVLVGGQVLQRSCRGILVHPLVVAGDFWRCLLMVSGSRK